MYIVLESGYVNVKCANYRAREFYWKYHFIFKTPNFLMAHKKNCHVIPFK